MSNKTLPLDTRLYDYLLSISVREPAALAQLRAETAQNPMHNMQIAPEQGRFMALLVELTGARKILEIGTFTGYSALSMALSMPAEGRIICCDINREWTDIARHYWQMAGVANRIELRLAPALETLDALLLAHAANTFDLAFIDADKINYSHYFERCLKLVRKGGLILIDNTLWGGAVADPGNQDPDTDAIRAFNLAVSQRLDISISLLPIADGLTMALKR